MRLCQVDLATPSTSTLVPGSVTTSHSFGTGVSWNQVGNGIDAGNWGEMFYGCGSTLSTGTNSSSCTATAQDGSPVPCNAGDVPEHGGQIVFGYGVDNAPAPYSGPVG